MKLVNIIPIILISIFTNISVAQTTVIPDPNFEQALIDINVDSDGVVNGEVLNADIETLTELDFSNLYYTSQTITDFSGIENFTALEILNLSSLSILLNEEQSDVFNSNFNLREFRADEEFFDVSPFISIAYLDFSNLNNLEYISLANSNFFGMINLNNPNANYENLTIDLSHQYYEPPNNTHSVCIKVNDVNAASTNQYPYNTWNVIISEPDQNEYVFRDYEFSSSCNLSTSGFDFQTKIKVYPNPVNDKLWFNNPNQLKIIKVELYTISGQLLNTFSTVG
ncbi:MAG: T9SS type A sorting domain-containing protein, partial [Psychroflexus salarius]